MVQWMEAVGGEPGREAGLAPHLRHVDTLMGFHLAEFGQVRVVVLPIWVEVAGGREEGVPRGPPAPLTPPWDICPPYIAGLGIFSLSSPEIGIF